MTNIEDKKLIKRIVIFLALVTVMLTMLTATAFAGGWHLIGNQDKPNEGKWLKSRSPHSGLQTSTNQCKVCHSVHDADDGSSQKSYKLLRDKSRVTECNSCHDATSGLSSKRPYQIGEFKKVRGEHSLGSTVIPDADTSKISNAINKDGLSCGSCHSVHAAKIMQNKPSQGKFADPQWENKLLKRDPAGNGGDASVSTAYDTGDVAGGLTVTAVNSNSANSYAASKTAFCADCHNRNSNWDDNAADDIDKINPNPNRPNSESHVQGKAADGLMKVDGKDTRVANFGASGNNETNNAGRSGWKLKQNTFMGCQSCHQAGSGGAQFPYNGISNSFPHQSTSSKLLMANYTNAEDGWVNERDTKGIRQSKRGINQAGRALASLDKVCLDCHRNKRGADSDTLGVGKDF